MKITSLLLLFSSVAIFGCVSTTTLEPLTEMPTAKPPSVVAMKMTGYQPQPGQVFTQIFVSNFSIKASQGLLNRVTARDGLPDALKNSDAGIYGFDLSGPNSANTYFSDLMLYYAGIQSSQQPQLYCASNLTGSTSSDALVYVDTRNGLHATEFLGLRDCEKSYLGLNLNHFDFDGDGIPDYLELRCGLNPLNANDANVSIVGDLTNLEKCRRNIPVDENSDSQPNKLFAYQYDQKLQADGTTTFTVSNMPILDDGQDNFIAFYIIETDTTSLQTHLYTAYTILNAGASGKTFPFPYWVTDVSHQTNQEIVFP